MKIAMLGHKRIPSREGGVEVVVEELATRMVERGHQVVAYNLKGKLWIPILLFIRELKLCRYPLSRKRV